ncbi:MAG: domain S-box [Rhodocyclales bacterium]|nr:domain S-box [Rhodocyclales bacterium]MDB5888579.1 domain S-box [Rhodocyclales bacterium]
MNTLQEQRAVTLSTAWLDRLGIGILVVHGQTVIRATTAAMVLLDRKDAPMIGRDVLQLFAPEDANKLRPWLKAIYTNSEHAGSLVVASDVGSPRHFRLTAGPNDGGSESTRIITIEEHIPGGAAANAAELRRTFKELLDGNPLPTFVLNRDHVVLHWNRACEVVLGVTAHEMVGTRDHWTPFFDTPAPAIADLIIDDLQSAEAHTLYGDTLKPSAIISDGLEASRFFPNLGDKGRWLLMTAAPIRNAHGVVMGSIETLVDITEIKDAEASLRLAHQGLEDLVRKRTAELESAKGALERDIEKREQAERALLDRYVEMTNLNIKLSEANQQIQAAQNQLLQNEKLASIGQLAAGVAHEINNPIGYVFSNFSTLEHYVADLLSLIEAYHAAEPHIADEAQQHAVQALRERLDLEFLKEDTRSLMSESREGIERVRKIVQDLKDFSHVDSDASWQWADLHKGIDSTLNIVSNEIKYHADVIKEYGQIPKIQCLPSQLNQVFMNLLVNAAHAMEGRPTRGAITVSSGVDENDIWVAVSDTGCGMSEETCSKIFDPFYTTKPIGKGTGLGLSLSYGIVQKHHGSIDVTSVPGEGTRFCVKLPIRQAEEAIAR